MTNKTRQTMMAICITCITVFVVMLVVAINLLFQRCSTLETVLNNTQKEVQETQMYLMEIEQLHEEMVIKYNKMQAQMEELNTEPVVIQNQLTTTQIVTEESTPVIDYDYNYVLRVVASESMGEPLEGQMAVAQCIRETSKATGMTPEEVVKAPNQYTSPINLDLVTDSVREACERVFINGESVTDEPIRYFYSTSGGFTSGWHENSLIHAITIGNHKFFKVK